MIPYAKFRQLSTMPILPPLRPSALRRAVTRQAGCPHPWPYGVDDQGNVLWAPCKSPKCPFCGPKIQDAMKRALRIAAWMNPGSGIYWLTLTFREGIELPQEADYEGLNGDPAKETSRGLVRLFNRQVNAGLESAFKRADLRNYIKVFGFGGERGRFHVHLIIRADKASVRDFINWWQNRFGFVNAQIVHNLDVVRYLIRYAQTGSDDIRCSRIVRDRQLSYLIRIIFQKWSFIGLFLNREYTPVELPRDMRLEEWARRKGVHDAIRNVFEGLNGRNPEVSSLETLSGFGLLRKLYKVQLAGTS